MDIRKYIINNFKNSNIDDIKESIEASLKDNDEITLPGIGVFFEILWKNSSNEDKNKYLNILFNNIKEKDQ